MMVSTANHDFEVNAHAYSFIVYARAGVQMCILKITLSGQINHKLTCVKVIFCENEINTQAFKIRKAAQDSSI